MADNILAIRKAEYIQGKYKIRDDKKGEIFFLDYFDKLKEDRFETKANYGNWDAAQKHIEKYCPPHKQLKDIDTEEILSIKPELLQHCRLGFAFTYHQSQGKSLASSTRLWDVNNKFFSTTFLYIGISRVTKASLLDIA